MQIHQPSATKNPVLDAWLERLTHQLSYEDMNKFYPNAEAVDHGAASKERNRTVKDMVDSIGTSLSATIILRHNTSGNTTTYTLTTSETTPSNITVIMEHGVIVDGAGTWTINGPFIADLSPHFGASITIVFGTPQPLNIEWWGVSASESAANNRTYANKALAAAINKGKLKVNGLYEVSDVLQITIGTSADTIFIEGNGWHTGFYQVTSANPILESTTTGADIGATELVLKDIYFYSDATATDGLMLRRCRGILENIKVYNVSAKAFNFEGCISLTGGHLWATTVDVGFRFGCYHSATKDNSTNACSFQYLKVTNPVTSGVLFEGDSTNGLRPKGNLINGLTTYGGTTAKMVHFKGGWANTIVRGYIEDGDDGLYMENDDGGEEARFNRLIHPYFIGQDGSEINLITGEDLMIDGGYMGATAQVDIAAGVSYAKFLYVRNFPVEGGTLNDAGTGTLIQSHGDGASDHAYNYLSQHLTFENAKKLRWVDSGGTGRSILGLDASDDFVMHSEAGDIVMKWTFEKEARHYVPIVFNKKTQQLTEGTNFTRADGNIFFLTTDGDPYNFNPSGTFLGGAMVIIFNLDAAQTITFDWGGLALAIATGKIALCSYDGSNWRGAVIN